MDKEDIKRLAKRTDFIPGIYNYCDRWCQRCSFTSRCMNYAMSEEQFGDAESPDMDEDLFWEKLRETFQVTLDLVKESAEDLGIDLDSVESEKEILKRKADREEAKNHDCSLQAKEYSEMVKNWFESAEDAVEKKEEELNRNRNLSMGDGDPSKEAAALLDASEVVMWYQHFIWVKLVRAVRSSIEERTDAENEFPKDSDGSAKVALIAMDRSLAAWGVMYKHYPEHEDEILNVLVHLERLRRLTEDAFPESRSFIRPGLDTEDSGA